MTETPEDGSAPRNGKIPRPAILVVAVGIFASLAIYGLSFVPGSGSIEIEWDTIEPIKSPPAKQLGNGSVALARTSISALAPNEEDLLIYRVAGVIRIDSGGRQLTEIRCDVFSRPGGDTRMARSTRLRAAWPKPSDNLQAQPVPETSFVRFATGGSNKVDLPIRDVIQRYTDSTAPTEVEWDGYIEDDQNWIWTMSDGTGVGAATLPWVVIFEAEERPKGSIDCKAEIGGETTRIKVPFRQQEWPIVDDEANAGDADTGDVSNVE